VAAAVLEIALPRDDEVATWRDGDRRIELAVRGGGVDAKLTAHGHARRIVALGIDAVAATVLTVARPCDDEITGRPHRQRVKLLMAGRGRIDAELAALRPARRVVALGVNAARPAVLIRAGPGDDKVARRVHGDGGPHLVVGCGRVDEELAPLGRAGRVVS